MPMQKWITLGAEQVLLLHSHLYFAAHAPLHIPMCREGGEGVTTYVLAGELGISRQGVDRIRNRALALLRKACQADAELAATLQEVCDELA